MRALRCENTASLDLCGQASRAVGPYPRGVSPPADIPTSAAWTWAGCGYIDQLWVRADRRREGLGTRLLAAAESEARTRGCVLMVVSTHSFQAPELFQRRGYVERGRVEGYPQGHAHIHLAKEL